MEPIGDESAAAKISARIAGLGDWRGAALAHLRRLICEADPEVVEEWKWAKPTSPGVPVWSHSGILCTGETYASYVKLTFARGAALADPARLFNASLEGSVRRAIDVREGKMPEEGAFRELIRAAVRANLAAKAGRAR